jgi:hypothetical protein
MKTHLQITFPQHPGQAFPIAASNGQTLPTRARSDTRPKKGYPVRILTRAEWDDQNKPAGPYLAAYQPMRPVPDVDFEAEDGSLWPTAEACLEHELETRFGVKTLAEVEAQIKAIADKAKLTVGDCQAALYDANGNPLFSGVQIASDRGVVAPKPMTTEEEAAALTQVPTSVTITDANQPTPDEAARLLASALSRRGLKVAEAAQATGLTPAQVRATADSLPGQFEQKGGRIHLIS